MSPTLNFRVQGLTRQRHSRGPGADLDSTTVTKLEGHAELVTELVNPLLQTYIIANDDNYGAQLAA